MVVAAEAAMVEVAEGAVLVVAAVMVVVAVVVLLVVEESHGTILGLKITRFCRFLKRRNGRTYGRTYGRTDIRTDIRTDRPSYRDARTHLKMKRRHREYIALTHWAHLFPSVALVKFFKFVKLGQFFKDLVSV